MKKIAVLTWFGRGRNYEILQAFALYHTLTRMGYACELLSYGKRTPRLSEEEINELTGGARELQIKYTAFIKRRLNYSIRLKDRESLETYLLSRDFDVLLCGSDQVWNASLPFFDTAFFLDFNIPCRKVSYAASMLDIRYISEFDRFPQIARLLEGFAAVSVRENTARTIVRRLTGGKVDAAVVLDPTLLLTQEDWLHTLDIPRIENGSYIFCYMFHISDMQIALLQKMARANGCSTVIFSDILKSGCPEIEGLHVELAETVSIERFLSLIRNAAAVLTDSFHGTAFSIQFEREFFAVESDPQESSRIDKGYPRNIDRLETLLEKAGLMSRLLRYGEEDMAQMCMPIDYAAVKTRIAAQRRDSLSWLREAIG